MLEGEPKKKRATKDKKKNKKYKARQLKRKIRMTNEGGLMD